MFLEIFNIVKRSFRLCNEDNMNIVIAGAGAWGTAMAIHLSRIGRNVTLVPRRLSQALELTSRRENRDYLPGIVFPPGMQIGHALAPALLEADVVLLACPSQGLRETCKCLKTASEGAVRLQQIVSLSKGLELGSHLRASQIIKEFFPDCRAGSLSGPTNAREVASGLPAAMVLAMEHPGEKTLELQRVLSGETLRIYTSDDVAGVEYAGALKNIYAIAAGVGDGLGVGDNARAALITRALAEMIRLGTILGAKTETFYGLSGVGDLVATATATWSRNHEFGRSLGEGASINSLLSGRKTVVEGYRTCESFGLLCRERGINAPIIEEMYQLLFEGKNIKSAVSSLMTRELKQEV